MERTKKILNKIFPYSVLLAISIIGTYIVFYDGFAWGSDFQFHFSSMLDKYNTILENGSFSVISGNLALGLGVGNGLFYSPLSHIIPVLVALILKVFGISLLSAFKITFVLNVFLSGVFMYRFAMHFTKSNKIASLLASATYILYPYRLFNAFCRLAIAEAFSFLFIPLFLMGLYDITHMGKEKINLIPFCEVILGGALLYLTHNITALFVFIIGIIYLIANIGKLIPLLKHKKYILCASVSVILLVGITSIMLFSQFELMNTGLYNLTDEIKMWTNPEKVASRGGEEFSFCGFLNISFLKGKDIKASTLYLEMLFYFLGCGLFTVSEALLKKVEKLGNYTLFISCVLLFGIPTIILPRLEVYFGLIVFFLVYLFIYYTKEKSEKPQKKIYKSVLFWFSIGVIIVAFIFMELGELWLYMPRLLRNIQFPWRLWSLVQISASILVGIISNYLGTKRISYIAFACVVGFLMVSNQALVEKRLAHYEGKRWEEGINEEMYETHSSIGFNSEYCPQVFFDKAYRSNYQKSLYYKIKYVIPYDFNYDKYYFYQPVALDGNGAITVNSAFAPNYEMEIKAEEQIIVQMPLIYYPGYKINIENTETNGKIKLNGENIDGLVAFTLNKGSYSVTTEYEGTTLRKISVVFTVISSLAVVLAIGYEIITKKREENGKGS